MNDQVLAPPAAANAAAQPDPDPVVGPSRTVLGAAVKLLRRIVILAVNVAFVLAAWQFVIWAFSIDPLVLPGPFDTLDSLWALLQTPVVYQATWVTFQEAMFGFAIGAMVGVVLAVALAEFDLLHRLVNPYVVAFQALPKVALTPLFIVWFGFGIWSKVVLIATFVFFPVMVNMYTGLRSFSPEEEELMRVSHATRLQRLRHLRLYRSLPYLFASFEASFVLCLTGAVFAELLGSGTSVGLGTLVQLYTSRLAMPGLFAVISLLGLFGVVLDFLVKAISRACLTWDRPGH